MVEVWLTEQQKQILDLYTKAGHNQAEISKIIYGTEERQSEVSKILRTISKRLNKPITKIYSKNSRGRNLNRYNVDV